MLWGFYKAVCPLLITHNTVGVLQSSLPSADYPLLITHKAVCPLLITHNAVGVLQSSLPSADYPQYCGGFADYPSSLPSADYPQYCGGFTKQFALC